MHQFRGSPQNLNVDLPKTPLTPTPTDTALPLGLRLAPQKCELICFQRPGTIDKNTLPQIKLVEHIVPWKTSVVYLGSRFTEDGNVLAAVKHRV